MKNRPFMDCCALLSNTINTNMQKAMIVYEQIRHIFPELWKLEGATLLARMILELLSSSDVNDVRLDKLFDGLIHDFRPRLIHELHQLFRHFESPFFVENERFEGRLSSSSSVLLYCLGLRRIGHDDDKLQNWMREWDVSRERHHRMMRIGEKIGILPVDIKGEWLATPPPAPETIVHEPTPVYDTCSLPYPRTIPSKSNNILNIRASLQALHNPLLSPEEMQERLERDCATVSIARQRTQYQEGLRRTGGINQETSVNAVILKWLHKFTAVIECLLGRQNGDQSTRQPLTPNELQHLEQIKLTNQLFLTLLDPLDADVIALNVIRQLMRVNDYNIEMNGYPVVIVSRSLGEALQNEIFAIQMTNKTLLKMTSLR